MNTKFVVQDFDHPVKGPGYAGKRLFLNRGHWYKEPIFARVYPSEQAALKAAKRAPLYQGGCVGVVNSWKVPPLKMEGR